MADQEQLVVVTDCTGTQSVTTYVRAWLASRAFDEMVFMLESHPSTVAVKQ